MSKRKALISNHRKTSRGSLSGIPLPASVRLGLKNIYLSEIRKAIRTVKKMLVPELDLLIAEDQTIRLDASSSAATRLKDTFRAMFIGHFGGLVTGGDPNIAMYGKWVKKILDPKIESADKSHKREFTRTFKRVIGVDPIAKEPGLGEALDIYSAYNVNKITTLSHDYFNDIQDIVFRGLQSGTSNRSIVKEVQASIDKTGEASVANAKLIATDQIQKLNGDLDRKRQQSNGGSRYYWQTRRNGVVRNKNNSNGYSDHAQLEGAVFKWGNPPITVFKGKRAGERNEPGQDINCKCLASMVIDDLLDKKSKKLIAAEAKTEKLRQRGVL